MALDCEMPYSITIMPKHLHCGVNLSLTLNQRVVGSNPTAPTIFSFEIGWLFGRGPKLQSVKKEQTDIELLCLEPGFGGDPCG